MHRKWYLVAVVVVLTGLLVTACTTPEPVIETVVVTSAPEIIEVVETQVVIETVVEEVETGGCTFNAYRMGPQRDTPDNGRVKITFLGREGRPLNWLENTAYALEALPADRWVEVGFKAHIPPQARSCRVEILPDRRSPDTVILDQGILRYALGNDLALEGLFPYLRYRE